MIINGTFDQAYVVERSFTLDHNYTTTVQYPQYAHTKYPYTPDTTKIITQILSFANNVKACSKLLNFTLLKTVYFAEK